MWVQKQITLLFLTEKEFADRLQFLMRLSSFRMFILQDNYLSCSIDTKAEIVVPIFKNGENIGQIDIDSHTIDPFTKEDLELLEWLCNEVSKIL